MSGAALNHFFAFVEYGLLVKYKIDTAMNKVILLSDKEQLPKGAFDFACMLNEQQPILLVGVFLPKVDYWDTQLYYSFGAAAPWINYVPGFEPDVLVAEEAATQFRTLCERNGIEYRIHDKKYEDIRAELRTESRFADLILFSNEAFYDHLDDVISDEYVEGTLRHAECPVVVVPEKFHKPENVVLAYDGTTSSVYAIRQFAALMPELAQLETILVYADPDDRHDFPDKDYIEELVARHYGNLTLLRLELDPRSYFGTWLAERRNTILVTGAQGRRGLSRLFRRSFIAEVLSEHKLPVFIAHR
jgi:hypothetical protein